MHLGRVMHIATARDFFATLASRGHDPRLADASGSWQFDVEGIGSWLVRVDHGAFDVSEGAARQPESPTVTLQMSESELVRLANGENHENMLTALLRGVVRFGGSLRFAQRLFAIVPLPEDWRASR
jgi:hypothetical protein